MATCAVDDEALAQRISGFYAEFWKWGVKALVALPRAKRAGYFEHPFCEVQVY